MRISDGFRCAGRARRTEDAGNRVGSDQAVEVPRRQTMVFRIAGSVDDPKPAVQKRSIQPMMDLVGDQRDRLEVVNHRAQDRRRQALIEWRVAAPGLENRQRPGDRIVALRQQQCDRRPLVSESRARGGVGRGVGVVVQVRIADVVSTVLIAIASGRRAACCSNRR